MKSLQLSPSIALAILCAILSFQLFAQNGFIKGTIKEAGNNESIPAANILLETGEGVAADMDGHFVLEVTPGWHKMTISAVSFTTKEVDVKVKPGETKNITVELQSQTEELGIVVVSGSKRGKKLEEEVVSVDVLKSDIIQNTNAKTLDEALEKVPGFYMLDDQANMRGGTGYSNGAGSRISMVVDGLPLITGDRSAIKWTLLPIENIEQVEVVKGASSVLYGSSALNGVIHVRTAFPKDEPETKLIIYQGMVGKPKREEIKWWDTNPLVVGGYFNHMRKIKKVDFVIGGGLSSNKGHREGEIKEFGRLNTKVRYMPEKFNGRLTVGLNANGMYYNEGLYFYWQNANEGALMKGAGDLNEYSFYYFDPYLTYFDKKNNKHSFKARSYGVQSIFSHRNKSMAHITGGEYTFAKSFERELDLTVGANGYHFKANDKLGKDLKDHSGSISAVFGQVDKKFGRLSTSLGMRWELFSRDAEFTPSVPILKAGLNMPVTQHTYIRASFGQGYRIPSIAEQFVDHNVGGISLYPNPDLEPEFGWNAEIGAKRTLKIGDWKGYIDIVGFWTEYKDMLEAVFVFKDNDPNQPGFQVQNVDRTRVGGFEVTTMGEGKIKEVPFSVIAGYTYVYPADLSLDTTVQKAGTFLHNLFASFGQADEEALGTMLKYRFRHIARLDAEIELIDKLVLGAAFNYYSYMDNVDQFFVSYIDGLEQYRLEHNSGDLVIDTRAAFKITPKSKITLVIENILNREYSLRPAKVDAPRNYTLQYQMTF